MKEVVLTVENVAKQYRLGVLGTGTLSHDLNRWWHLARGKEDPYLRVGESNNRATVGDSEYVWALKNINFEVRQGEVLGIIGKNGAGKSTLLKILSKVTTPTTGVITMKGRVASLLEVGTGFHPEQTGRENIYLNGAILGMVKKEIDSKLDEIIDFSGCQRYIDTPVKRYSSGMKVRLAFAVAAFLEPEILIVDEVLAVGDAEFQKKAIGKMKDVSQGQGRTVLFVSHNIAAVKSICSSAILLENGELTKSGDVETITNAYLKGDSSDTLTHKVFEKGSTGFEGVSILEVGVKSRNSAINEPIPIDDQIEFFVKYHAEDLPSKRVDINFRLKAEDGTHLFSSSTVLEKDFKFDKENSQFSMFIPANFFNIGQFYVDFMLMTGIRGVLVIEDIITFIVSPDKAGVTQSRGSGTVYLRPTFEWKAK